MGSVHGMPRRSPVVVSAIVRRVLRDRSLECDAGLTATLRRTSIYASVRCAVGQSALWRGPIRAVGGRMAHNCLLSTLALAKSRRKSASVSSSAAEERREA